MQVTFDKDTSMGANDLGILPANLCSVLDNSFAVLLGAPACL